MSFPERLKAARLQLGLTQEQLAFELNVTKSAISAWENGRDAPGFRLLPALKKSVGVSLDALICGDESASQDAADAAPEYGVTIRNSSEAALVKAYRGLPVKRREALLSLLD